MSASSLPATTAAGGWRTASPSTTSARGKALRLDIAPTREMYRDTTDAFARAVLALVLPHPARALSERMIAADPDQYWLDRRKPTCPFLARGAGRVPALLSRPAGHSRELRGLPRGGDDRHRP
jgi:hypothetical protein